jgi:hypothetical protein
MLWGVESGTGTTRGLTRMRDVSELLTQQPMIMLNSSILPWRYLHEIPVNKMMIFCHTQKYY